jgi:hypothetical protein
MEFNRNHYFMAGLVFLFLGIQLRLIDSYVLNEKVSKLVAPKTSATSTGLLLPAIGPTPRKVIRPPQWLGWALMSVGSVLMLHSFAMPKPAG